MSLKYTTHHREEAIKALIKSAARYRKKRQHRYAERICKEALQEARSQAGEVSPLVGLALLELMNIYDEEGRVEDSEAAWQGVREIIISFLHNEAESEILR